MSTAHDGEDKDSKPDLEALVAPRSAGSAKDQAIAALEATLSRHDPGWIGKIFGGQVNAATNIIGVVAILAIAMIAIFGFLDKNASSAIEVAKAALFLSIGYFSSKKIDTKDG